jgi:hypothetical protein
MCWPQFTNQSGRFSIFFCLEMLLQQHLHRSKWKFFKRHVSLNLSRVLVRFDYVACFIVNADHSIV